MEDVLKTQFDVFIKGSTVSTISHDLLGDGIFVVDGGKWKHQRKAASNFFSMNMIRDAMEHVAFERASSRIMARFQQPMCVWKLARWLNVGAERQMAKDMKLINDVVYDVIHRNFQEKKRREQNGEPSNSDPKVRRELAYKLPRLGLEAESPSLEDIDALIYLEAAIRECIRLNPVAPILQRIAAQDTTLYNGTFIKAGTRIILPHYAMGHLETVWGSDAEEFKPERWIDDNTGKLIHVSPYKFTAFLAGPRMCLGMRFALAEMKITLATIFSKFDIQTVKNPLDFTYVPSVTLQRCALETAGTKSEMKLEAITAWVSPASVAVSCMAVLLVYLVTPSAHDRAVKHLPTPEGDYPILRHTLEIIKAQKSGTFLDWALKYCRKYQGKPWSLRIMGKHPAIVVCCPEAFEDIQKTQFDAFDKSPFVSEALYDVLGQGIFAVSGPLWQHQRKTASHLFTAQMMQYAMEVVVPEKGEELVKRLNGICLKEKEAERVVNMKRLLDLYTMDVFAKVGFDVDLHGVESNQNAELLDSFERMSARMLVRIQQPMWVWKLLRWLNIGAEKQLAEDVKAVDDLVYGVISRSIEEKNRQGVKGNSRKDLITLFIEKSKVEYTKGVHTKKDLKLMRDFVISFLAAGRETTATTMSWAILMLNRYPKVLERVRQEIKDKLPDLASGKMRSPNLEDIQQLVYLEAVVRETLRLFPVVAVSGRSATRDFSVFLGGPRICLGMKFALAEVKITLAKLLSQLDFKTVKDPFDFTYRPSITLQIKGPLDVAVSRAKISSRKSIPKTTFPASNPSVVNAATLVVASAALIVAAPPVDCSRVRPPPRRQLQYVTSDTIDRRLLQGLTSADDDTRPVNLIQDEEGARRVLQKIEELGPNHFHACDTEVAQIDVKAVGPVGNGVVTCLSLYSGPDVDYGNGPYVWVDNLDSAEGTLQYFKEFLESKKHLKVWHNYSFDRHVLFNHDINVQGLGGDTMHMARLWNTARFQNGGYSLESLTADLLLQRKKPMKELFGIPKLKKDGSKGKERIMPTVEELQRFPEFRKRWIRYSVYDAESTWFLHRVLQYKLDQTFWFEKPQGDENQAGSMYDFYRQYIIPFGECLTDIERKGMHVDLEYLAGVEKQALEDRTRLEKLVLKWASRYLENTEGFIEEGKQKAKKKRNMIIRGLGIPPTHFTASGLPAASAEVLKDLAGHPEADPPQYGRAYDHFEDKEEGAAACVALKALFDISSINTMLNNFILPLQELADSNSRVHCSLNLNTDTGRLSSRKPNLQNQPAMGKDRYKIRDAFTAPPGKKLIVADYSQLELRLMAHITQCKAMIEAFKAGGDFHSRTAMGMYPYVAKAVDNGDALLEWDHTSGKEPPAPLLKDKYGDERKNAKVLNFSIAYGKTAFGLAKDFNVSRKEAADTLEKWYADRGEVRHWQKRAIETARTYGYTRTLLGRYRRLPDAMLKDDSMASKKARGHAERAAINTPIQGAAADVVMQAMLQVHQNPRLRELGWKMVSQIHDEIIVEGPEESVDEAMKLVVHLMENPFQKPLSVALEVDAKVDDSCFPGVSTIGPWTTAANTVANPGVCIFSVRLRLYSCAHLKLLRTAFGKNPLFVEAATDVLGQGVFAISGPLWHHQRKTASRLFSTQMIQHSMDVVVPDKCKELMKRLDIAAQQENTVVSLKWMLDLFTMDVFCKVGFGIEMQGMERQKIIAMLEALQRSSARVVGRILEPSWCWKLRRYLNIGAERQFATDMTRVNDMLYGFITRSIQDKANRGGSECRMDLISLLEQHAVDNGKDAPFHPKKLRDFLRSDGDARCDDVERSVSCQRHVSSHAALHIMGRMNSVWGQDAEEFKPDRWIDPVTRKILAVSAFTFSAFYGGPHACLGMKFAMSEIKITLATLLSRYNFKTSREPFDYTYRMALSLRIDGGLDVAVTSLD
ncbi:Ribonuclease H-like domain [Phytophthora cactorum]|nr:Ribonuclease H-like domain [Phytophthora cactorum]